MTDAATSTFAQLMLRRQAPARTGAGQADRLCHTILARVQPRSPAELAAGPAEGAATRTLLQRHAAALSAQADDGDGDGNGARATAAAPAAEPPPREKPAASQASRSRLGKLPPLPPETGPAPADLDRLLRRLDRSLAARDAPGGGAARSRDHRRTLPAEDAPPQAASRQSLRRSDGSAAARAAIEARFPPIVESAADLPDLKDLPHRGMRAPRLKRAVPSSAAPMSVPLRLACHAINATVMVLVLPVGAAMTVHALLRGESLNASGRTLALMGMAVGLQHSPVGAQILALI